MNCSLQCICKLEYNKIKLLCYNRIIQKPSYTINLNCAPELVVEELNWVNYLWSSYFFWKNIHSNNSIEPYNLMGSGNDYCFVAIIYVVLFLCKSLLLLMRFLLFFWQSYFLNFNYTYKSYFKLYAYKLKYSGIRLNIKKI